MIIMAVDDERLMLDMLVKALKASADVDMIYDFSSASAALEWVTSHPVDAAFLDINMRGMHGMELAAHIQAVQPNCDIVFCTGYSEFAVDAFRIHASGYLMKPITANAVQNEIDHIKRKHIVDKPLTVRCFGNFEVMYQNEPLYFRRTKTKEMFAYLVDRNGASVTAKQICAVLWEDDIEEEKHMNYFWQLLDDLRNTLKTVDSESVLVKVGKSYAVDMTQIDCDYSRYLESGQPVFYGEYMNQYSWAEDTAGYLARYMKI